MDAYIEVLEGILVEGKVCSRVRFLLMDVVELRERQWVPRPLQRTTAVKTVTQVIDLLP